MQKILKCLSLLPAAFMLSVIFLFSAQTGNTSGSLSGAVAEKLVSTLRPELSPKDVKEKADALQFPIRKLAHFSEYFVLALTFLLPLFVFGLRGRRLFFWAVFLSFLSAAGDEYHQSLVPGRGPSFRDVCIDTAGAFLASCLTVRKSHER